MTHKTPKASSRIPLEGSEKGGVRHGRSRRPVASHALQEIYYHRSISKPNEVHLDSLANGTLPPPSPRPTTPSHKFVGEPHRREKLRKTAQGSFERASTPLRSINAELDELFLPSGTSPWGRKPDQHKVLQREQLAQMPAFTYFHIQPPNPADYKKKAVTTPSSENTAVPPLLSLAGLGNVDVSAQKKYGRVKRVAKKKDATTMNAARRGWTKGERADHQESQEERGGYGQAG